MGSFEPLLERESELTQLRGILGEAQESRGAVALVEAPAGLGKTSLLRASWDTAAELGFTCLRARATELERDFAYGCVRQLLEPYITRAAEPARNRLFAGAAGLAQPLFAPTQAPQGPTSSDAAYSMLHGLYWLVANTADEDPLVLAVDDVHWADAESLRFLNYLAPRLDGLALAVIATTRSGEGVTADLARLVAAPETTVLRPRPLSTGATVRLCERRLSAEVAPEFAAACREAAGGNPFFLEALLREVAEQGLSPSADNAGVVRELGPAAVAESVLLRLADRPPAATALVRAVAVIGDGASLAEAAQLAELTEAEAVDAADLLIKLEILRPAEDLEFAHPIVREAVSSELGANERATAHAQAARILADSGAAEERVAAQIVEAEPAGDPERVELLRRVAAAALVYGAPAAAVAWLTRALAEPPPEASRGEVLLELSAAKLRLGTPEAAVDQLTEALELVNEPVQLSTVVRLLGSALTWSGDADRAVEAIGSVIEIIREQDREQALLLEADRAAYAQQGSLATRAPVASRLEQYADLQGATPGERLVLASFAFERARASETEENAVAHIARVLAGRNLLGEQELDVAGTLYLILVVLLASDALELADACVEEMLADARARASIPAQAFVILHRGWVSFKRGAVPAAEADARTALELLTTYDIRLGRRYALALLLQTLVAANEIDAAAQALRSSGLGDEIPAGMANNALLEARAVLSMAQGEARQAANDFATFGGHDERWGGANPLASRWRSQAALALLAAGDGEQAARLAAEDLERATRWGAASGLGIALRASGLVESGDGTVDRLQASVDALEGSPARLELARSLTELGAALRRANRRADAREVLQRGLELARQCGASALAEQARGELRIAGGRTADPDATGLAQLTASERRVAELAAEGYSNPEIAQALFVTRKTVETHLGRVYRKLGISGRVRLANALAEPVSTVDP